MGGLTGLNATPFPTLSNRFAPLNQLALQQQTSNYAPPAEAQLAPIEAPDAEAALDALGPLSARSVGPGAQTWPGLIHALASPFLHLIGLGGSSAAAPVGGILGVSPGWGLNTAFADQPMGAPQGGFLGSGPFGSSTI